MPTGRANALRFVYWTKPQMASPIRSALDTVEHFQVRSTRATRSLVTFARQVTLRLLRPLHHLLILKSFFQEHVLDVYRPLPVPDADLGQLGQAFLDRLPAVPGPLDQAADRRGGLVEKILVA